MAELAPAARRPAARPWPIRWSWPQVGMLALIGALGFYVLYPLFLILLGSFNTARIGQPPVYSLQPWIDAWSAPGLLQSLWNTLSVAFWYQAISFPIGIVLAWALARTNVPWARGLEFLFWLSCFIPALSTTLGWMLLLDPRVGVLNQVATTRLGLPAGFFNIYSFWASSGSISWPTRSPSRSCRSRRPVALGRVRARARRVRAAGRGTDLRDRDR